MSEANGQDHVTVTIDGTEYKVGRVGWKVLKKDAEEELRLQQRREFDEALKLIQNMDGASARVSLFSAMDSVRRSAVVPVEEVDSWLVSGSGTLYLFWRALQVHHPDIDRERSEQLFDRLSPDDYHAINTFLVKQVFGRAADALEKSLERLTGELDAEASSKEEKSEQGAD